MGCYPINALKAILDYHDPKKRRAYMAYQRGLMDGKAAREVPINNNNVKRDGNINHVVKQNSDLYEAYYEAGFTGEDAVRLVASHGLKLGEGK